MQAFLRVKMRVPFVSLGEPVAIEFGVESRLFLRVLLLAVVPIRGGAVRGAFVGPVVGAAPVLVFAVRRPPRYLAAATAATAVLLALDPSLPLPVVAGGLLLLPLPVPGAAHAHRLRSRWSTLACPATQLAATVLFLRRSTVSFGAFEAGEVCAHEEEETNGEKREQRAALR